MSEELLSQLRCVTHTDLLAVTVAYVPNEWAPGVLQLGRCVECSIELLQHDGEDISAGNVYLINFEECSVLVFPYRVNDPAQRWNAVVTAGLLQQYMAAGGISQEEMLAAALAGRLTFNAGGEPV